MTNQPIGYRCRVCGRLSKLTRATTVTAHFRKKHGSSTGRQYNAGDYCTGGGQRPILHPLYATCGTGCCGEAP
jgi:hypothetical protein